MIEATVNHEAARLVALQRQADRHEDRALDWKIRANPEHFRKMHEIRAAGERVRWQSELHGPFLQHSAPAWRISPPEDEVEISAARFHEHNRFLEAEWDYAHYVKAETGVSVTAEEYFRQRDERSEIRRQSHEIADRLESAGVTAYRNDAFRLWAWFVHSRHAEEIPAFRRICFLPYVAAVVRASKLAALEYYLQRNIYCRFWTFTSGTRCTVSELGDRITYLHKKLNRLNKALRKKWGVEMVFRSTELGSPETAESVELERAKRQAIKANKLAREKARREGRRDPGPLTRAQLKQFENGAGGIESTEHGEPLFHPHAHTVIRVMAGKPKPHSEWVSIINFVKARWRHHWDAGKLIGDARECCKYVTKPADMLKLTPEQLAEVERQLHGKRLVAPLGQLKSEIAARKAAGKILRRQRTPEGSVWREAFDQNKHVEQDQADRDAVFRMHQAEVMDRVDARHGYRKEGTLRRLSDPNVCRVLARQAPAVGPVGRKEPRVIIGGTVLDVRTIENHPLVARLWSGTVQAWEEGRKAQHRAAQADPIRVHTGTPTGFVRPFDFLPDVPERSKPPSEPVFAGEN